MEVIANFLISFGAHVNISFIIKVNFMCSLNAHISLLIYC